MPEPALQVLGCQLPIIQGGTGGVAAAGSSVPAVKKELEQGRPLPRPQLQRGSLRRTWCEKRHLLFECAFPMFVPSLSWQNDHVYI
jgi:hypothetical protein